MIFASASARSFAATSNFKSAIDSCFAAWHRAYNCSIIHKNVVSTSPQTGLPEASLAPILFFLMACNQCGNNNSARKNLPDTAPSCDLSVTSARSPAMPAWQSYFSKTFRKSFLQKPSKCLTLRLPFWESKSLPNLGPPIVASSNAPCKRIQMTIVLPSDTTLEDWQSALLRRTSCWPFRLPQEIMQLRPSSKTTFIRLRKRRQSKHILGGLDIDWKLIDQSHLYLQLFVQRTGSTSDIEYEGRDQGR